MQNLHSPSWGWHGQAYLCFLLPLRKLVPVLPKYSATFISLSFTVHNLAPFFRIAPQVTATDVNQWDIMQADSRTQVRWWRRRGAMAGLHLWEPIRDSGSHKSRGAQGDGSGVAVTAPSAAAQHPGKLPKTHIISDERQTKRGK